MLSARFKSLLRRSRRALGLLGVLSGLTAGGRLDAASILIGQTVSPPGDLSNYIPPESAKTIRIGDLWRVDTARMGFLGVTSTTNAAGQVVVTGVAPESPALKAGLRTNDVILSLNDEAVSSPENLRTLVESNLPGKPVTLALLRNAAATNVTAQLTPLGAVGRPIERIRLGVVVGEVLQHGGVRVDELDDNSTGASAGLKVGDVILRVNGTRITETNRLPDLLAGIEEDNALVTVVRGEEETPLHARLAPAGGPDRPASSFAYRAGSSPAGYNVRARRDVLRLAIIGLEFPDVRHNPNIGAVDWEQAYFSTKSYVTQSATGQSVHGSLNDFYQEQSSGAMRVGGRMLGWLEMSQNRAAYSAGANQPAAAGRGYQRFGSDESLLTEALQKLVAREGSAVFANFDGFCFIYAGAIATRNDSDVFWPHTSLTFFQNRAVRYSVSYEGGERMTDISILCHETGHILGLPDLYVRPPQNLALSTSGTTNAPTGAGSRGTTTRVRNANPYADTLANWDLMAVQAGNGRPEHMSAWSKEQLGWIKPAVVDPRVPQQLILSPMENASNQCVKIPLRPDGTEYLLLENRRRIGFDQSLPGEGLLIWRVVYGRPVLEEAHGYRGANAAFVSQARIPYPTERNNSFTPFSRPSSAAYTGNELPVYINNIRRLPDGRIAFSLGNGYL